MVDINLRSGLLPRSDRDGLTILCWILEHSKCTGVGIFVCATFNMVRIFYYVTLFYLYRTHTLLRPPPPHTWWGGQ